MERAKREHKPTSALARPSIRLSSGQCEAAGLVSRVFDTLTSHIRLPSPQIKRSHMSDERPLKVITRRDLLKGAGLASAAAMAGHAGLPAEAEASAAPMAQSPATVPARVVFENLTAAEGDL